VLENEYLGRPSSARLPRPRRSATATHIGVHEQRTATSTSALAPTCRSVVSGHGPLVALAS
jgi:hypothetical protein